MAKAALWSVTDAEARKRGEQTGLDTLVVHAVTMSAKCWRVSALQCCSKRIKHSAWGVRPQG